MLLRLFLMTLPGLIDPAPKPPPVQHANVQVVKPPANATPRQAVTIQCGLVVYHVDASLDPKFVIEIARKNLDPKIAVRPPAPCTTSK